MKTIIKINTSLAETLIPEDQPMKEVIDWLQESANGDELLIEAAPHWQHFAEVVQTQARELGKAVTVSFQAIISERSSPQGWRIPPDWWPNTRKETGA